MYGDFTLGGVFYRIIGEVENYLPDAYLVAEKHRRDVRLDFKLIDEAFLFRLVHRHIHDVV